MLFLEDIKNGSRKSRKIYSKIEKRREYNTITTSSKKMITTIISINNCYRYKVSLEWTKIPSTRSYDIIGLGIDNTVKVYSIPVFQ